MTLYLPTDLAVIFPLHIPIPHRVTFTVSELLVRTRIISSFSKPTRKRHLRLNFITVPLLSVLVLLASGAIDGTVIRRGIVGADGVKPINIMALFISLVRYPLKIPTIMIIIEAYGQAYISISLDFTGLLRFSAFWVARKGGASGQLLYLYLYAFFLICGVIVGNVREAQIFYHLVMLRR